MQASFPDVNVVYASDCCYFNIGWQHLKIVISLYGCRAHEVEMRLVFEGSVQTKP